MHDELVLALEIGGTCVRGGLVSRSGELRAAARHDTEAHRGADHVLRQAAAVLESVQQTLDTQGRARLRGLGISSAGVIDTACARVVAAGDTLPGWAGTELRRHFQACTGLPVQADNDANCALAGELWRGGHAVADDAPVAMITLGTGLGGAWALGGRVVVGATQRAGHFGSVRTWHGSQQAFVPLESLVSGSGLRNLYHLHAAHDAPRAAGGLQVAQWAADPLAPAHAAARAALQEWVELLAGFLHDLHVSMDPGLVIVGGGVLSSRALWWEALLARLAAARVPLTLAPARLGDEAGLLGAARLAWAHRDR